MHPQSVDVLPPGSAEVYGGREDELREYNWTYGVAQVPRDEDYIWGD